MVGGWVGRIARVGSVVVAAGTLIAFVGYWPHAPWTAGNPFVHVPREDVRPVLRDVAVAWRDGDRLVVYDGAAAAVRFYWRGDPADVVVLPAFNPGDAEAVERVGDVIAMAFEDMRADADREVDRSPAHVWLIISHLDPGDEDQLRTALDNLAQTPAHIIASDGASAWRIDVLPPSAKHPPPPPDLGEGVGGRAP